MDKTPNRVKLITNINIGTNEYLKEIIKLHININYFLLTLVGSSWFS